MQYGKMIITIILALYSTRVVLSGLGASDFGIYNLVAGVIAMLSFLNTSMTISTQRYLSYYMGGKDFEKLKAVFKSSVFLHLIIAAIIVLILEIVGIYLFNNVLKIPADRMNAAKIAFHCMVASTFFSINAVPYDASINAHEDLGFDAIIGVLDSLLKLAIAFWILETNYDKLIMYGALIAIVTVIIRVIKSMYCLKRYTECKVSLFNTENFNTSIFKEMISFAGWNTFGAIMSVCRNQGIAVVLNIFLGTVVNAAYGIANQVNSQVSSFSGSLTKSLNPQIIKSEGEGDRERMLRLAMTASKFSFFLFLFFCIPLIIEMPYVLTIWLGNVPEHTVAFCRLALIVSLMLQLSNGLMIAIQSVGKIKTYTTVVSFLLLLNLPISYLMLKMGFAPEYVFIVAIVLEATALVSRVLLAKMITGLKPALYVLRVLMPSVICFVLIFLISSCSTLLFQQPSFFRFLTTCAISVTLLPFIIWFSGTDKGEKIKIENLMKALATKLSVKEYKQ
ncbi:MAG: hypothetical protein ACTHMM_00975 [Agriterribacter sp.]